MQLSLTTLEDQPFELPASNVVFVEAAEKGCSIVYNLGSGNISESVSDQFGFISKQIKESGTMLEPLQVTIATEKKGNKFLTNRSNLISKKGLKDGENGAKTQVTFNFNGAVVTLNVKEKFQDV